MYICCLCNESIFLMRTSIRTIASFLGLFFLVGIFFAVGLGYYLVSPAVKGTEQQVF